MDLSDTFLAARDLLRAQGWTQGQREDWMGRLCLRGAVQKAVLGHAEVLGEPDPIELYEFHSYCLERWEHGSIHVNDRHLRSVDEACDLLEDAAKWAAGPRHE